MRARAHWRWLGAYLLLASGYAFGCSASSRDGAVVASDAESIVYGTDDRTEPYEDETSPSSLADAASNSTAVIVLQSDVQTSDDGSVRLESGTLQDAYGVCATERYADQPSAGFCTAMLVEPDVVMTAGHCLALMSCPRLALVFGFQYDSPGVLHRLTSSDVYGCAEVLLSKVSDPSDSQVLDYAFIRLDRPVAPPLQPLGLDHSGAALAEGSAVSLIGHGGGLPTKIARNGVVTDGRPETRDYFSATVDNYSGGSGSGVFDSENNLVGIAVRGEADFRTSDDGCQVSIRDDSGKGEQITYVSRADEALCAKGNPVGDWCNGTSHATASCSIALGVGAPGRGAAPWWFLLGLTGYLRFRRCGVGRAATGALLHSQEHIVESELDVTRRAGSAAVHPESYGDERRGRERRGERHALRELLHIVSEDLRAPCSGTPGGSRVNDLDRVAPEPIILRWNSGPKVGLAREDGIRFDVASAQQRTLCELDPDHSVRHPLAGEDAGEHCPRSRAHIVPRVDPELELEPDDPRKFDEGRNFIDRERVHPVRRRLDLQGVRRRRHTSGGVETEERVVNRKLGPRFQKFFDGGGSVEVGAEGGVQMTVTPARRSPVAAHGGRRASGALPSGCLHSSGAAIRSALASASALAPASAFASVSALAPASTFASMSAPASDLLRAVRTDIPAPGPASAPLRANIRGAEIVVTSEQAQSSTVPQRYRDQPRRFVPRCTKRWHWVKVAQLQSSSRSPRCRSVRRSARSETRSSAAIAAGLPARR